MHSENRLALDKVPKVFVCCAALHNLAKDCGLIDIPEDSNDMNFTEDEENNYNGDLNTRTGSAIRDRFALLNFNNN